ncbi:hypothetical protein NL676_017139 [Syzygium grande]|nr:hypothetical protein NL676_017139 [Syzygium grande]
MAAAAVQAAAGGGGTLSDLYQSAKRSLLRTRAGMERLERLEFSSSSSSSGGGGGGLESQDLSSSIKRDIAQIQSLCAEMERLWRSIAAKSQRDLWKRKVEQVAEETESLKESLDKHFLRNQKKMMEAKERAELLGRANGDSAHVLRIFDDEAQAMQSARNSARMLEESYATGVAILSKYSEQRERLKKAQRKALDVLNTVGLSNSVLKLIEKRHRGDRWIKRVPPTTLTLTPNNVRRYTPPKPPSESKYPPNSVPSKRCRKAVARWGQEFRDTEQLVAGIGPTAELQFGSAGICSFGGTHKLKWGRVERRFENLPKRDDPQERDRENRWPPSKPTTTTAVTVTVAAEHA